MRGFLVSAAVVGVVAAAVGVRVGAEEAATAPATSTAPAVPDTRWAGVVARLGSEDFAERTAAQKELEKATPGDMGVLRQLAEGSDVEEVKARLEGRVRELEEGLVLNPPGLTLELKDATLGDVAKALSGATGCAITSWPEDRFGGSRARYTLSAKDEPFWQVFAELSKQSGLRMQWSNGLQLMDQGGNGWRRVEQCGAAAVIPEQLTRSKVVNLQADVAKQVQPEQLMLQYVVAMDPRVPVVKYRPPVLTQVTDDAGNSLLLQRPQNNTFWWDAQDFNSHLWNQGESLQIPAHLGKRIVSAKGELHFIAATHFDRVEVPDLEKAKGKPIVVGGRTVTFTSVSIHKGSAQLQYSVVMGDPQAMRGNRNDVPGVTMRVSDGTGKVVWTLMANIGQSGAGYGGELTPPLKVQVSAPTTTKEVTLGFEMRDLALP